MLPEESAKMLTKIVYNNKQNAISNMNKKITFRWSNKTSQQRTTQTINDCLFNLIICLEFVSIILPPQYHPDSFLILKFFFQFILLV